MDLSTGTSQVGLVAGLSTAIDLMDPALHRHHRQVAIIACQVGEALSLPEGEIHTLFLAGLLHDVGALSFAERLDLMHFEESSDRGPGREWHGEVGYHLLRDFTPLGDATQAIRFHHVEWRSGRGHSHRGFDVTMASHILHLSDRLAVLLKPGRGLLEQAASACKKIKAKRGETFAPKIVDALLEAASRESFWLEVQCLFESDYGLDPWEDVPFDLGEVRQLAELFCRLVDFRSRFTATHTSGVAAMSKALGRLFDLPAETLEGLELAGHLHDLGKLSVPVEVLEKPTALTPSQFNRIKAHSYETFRILKASGVSREIVEWASYHHERLNGHGYPFHKGADELSLECRIVAVADVFTALTENRPYRQGMDASGVARILQRMCEGGALDGDIVAMVRRNFDELNGTRAIAQASAENTYQTFLGRIGSAQHC